MSRGPSSASAALAALALPLLLQVLKLPRASGSCGAPDELDFAMLPEDTLKNNNTYPYDYKMTYICKPGYQRNKYISPTRYCLKDGTWTDARAFCNKKLCPLPEDLPHGQITAPEGFFFGSVIFFKCDKGYLLVGQSQSQCELAGEHKVGWSDPFPKCKALECDPPPEIGNGTHTGDSKVIYKYGSSVRYICDEIYSLIGSEFIYCTTTTKNMSSGEWSDPPPICKVVRCECPVIPNGHLIFGENKTYTYKESMTLDCDPGFYMDGEDTIYCDHENNWSPRIPQCISDENVSPTKTNINNTRRTCGPTSSGDPTSSEKENQFNIIIPVITLIIFTQI